MSTLLTAGIHNKIIKVVAVMFGRKSSQENRYIIAIKNYDETVGLLREGKLSLGYDKSIYIKMIDSQTSRVDNLKDMKKFIRESGKSAKEVAHYWEGLIVDGYTLINVEYLDRIPAIDHVCGNKSIKFVCKV